MNNKIRLFIRIIFLIVFLYVYITIFINSSMNDYLNNEIKNRYNLDFNIKENILYNSLNKVISKSDMNNINYTRSVSKEIVEKNVSLKPIIYIYNTHDTEKYSLTYLSDYSITPDVKLASYILKDHLNDLNIGSYVEERSISKYLKKHNLNYYGCYKASRSYMKDSMKNNDYKILLDIHRDSVKHKYTFLKVDGVGYAKVMFVLAMKHKNYKKNLEFAKYLDSNLNKKYKGISRGIMKRKDEVFNQDLSENAMLIEVGGVDNTIEELNNTLEVLAQVLKDYIKERNL